MMESPLNKAHHYERKADTLLRSNKFDEAIVCHQKTAELLLEAMQLTQAEKALESVKLQRDYHLRRQGIIRYKQALLVKLSAMSKQATKAEIESPLRALDGQTKTADIQNAIIRHIEDNDSLLRGLVNVSMDASQTSDVVRSAVKTPKTEKDVIEELHINNENLRKLVKMLMKNVEGLQKENKDLISKLQLYELGAGQQRRCDQPLQVVTTDEGSPFAALSPGGDELDLGNGVPRDLPALPPLEMPNFDYAIFSSSLEVSPPVANIKSVFM